MGPMAGRRLVATLGCVLALSSCTAGTDSPPATPSGAVGTDTTRPSGETSLLVTPATPPAPGPTQCPTRGAAVIPDGTWAGPLTLRLEGLAGVPVDRSAGSGRLQLLVQDGQVVQGAWTMSWRATGSGTTDNGEARVRLTADIADIAGSVQGPAAKPSVHGAWTISGTVRVTSPVAATVPVAGSGEGDAVMEVRAGSCDAVTGTFALPSARRNPLVRLSGDARWVGHRAG